MDPKLAARLAAQRAKAESEEAINVEAAGQRDVHTAFLGRGDRTAADVKSGKFQPAAHTTWATNAPPVEEASVLLAEQLVGEATQAVVDASMADVAVADVAAELASEVAQALSAELAEHSSRREEEEMPAPTVAPPPIPRVDSRLVGARWKKFTGIGGNNEKNEA